MSLTYWLKEDESKEEKTIDLDFNFNTQSHFEILL